MLIGMNKLSIKYFIHLLFFLLLTSSMKAQSDSASYLSYFPINLGDWWKYEVTTVFSNSLNTDSLSVQETTLRINKETTIESGQTFLFFEGGIYTDGYYFRPDTGNTTIKILLPVNNQVEFTAYEFLPPYPRIYSSILGETLIDTTYGQAGKVDYYERQLFYYVKENGPYSLLLTKNIGISSWLDSSMSDKIVHGELIEASVNNILYSIAPTNIEKQKAIPQDFILYNNYPNPFNPSTIISYQINQPSFVTLKVYNILGQELKTLVNRKQSRGIHYTNFDTSKNSSPTSYQNKYTSGIYFYRLSINGISVTKKMMMLE
jgi:hypothetical protein